MTFTMCNPDVSVVLVVHGRDYEIKKLDSLTFPGCHLAILSLTGSFNAFCRIVSS